MAEIGWWYARGDEQVGPISAAELRRLASTGGILPSDLVWREGLAEWAPAARLRGLFPEAPPVARELAQREPAPQTVKLADAQATGPSTPIEAPPPLIDEPPLPDFTAPADALRETADLDQAQADEAVFASFTVAQAPPGAPPVAIPPAGRALDSTRRSRSVEQPTGGNRQRISYTHLAKILALMQTLLWGTCIAVILFGGLLFTWVRLKAKSPADEAASAQVFGTFFIGAYVIARAGEKISRLVLEHIENRRVE